MKAEFLRDENDMVWFSCAKDIHIRRIATKISLQNYESKKVGDTLSSH